MVTSENHHREFKEGQLHPPFLETPILNLLPPCCGKVLDIGCGLGDLGYLLKTRKNLSWLVGLDICKAYLSAIKSTEVYDELLLAKLPNLPLKDLPFFDYIFLLEVIEHLPKPSGYKLLDQLETMGRNIILSTPQRVPIDHCELNSFLVHLSEWTPQEFEKRGYTVITVHRYTRLHRITEAIRTFFFKRKLPSIYRLAYKQIHH